MLKSFHSNVWLMTLAQVFVASAGSLMVFVGSFVGFKFAPSQSVATLPFAFFVVGLALFTLPVVRLFEKIGRKYGFIICFCFGVFNSLFTAFSIFLESFWLFCCGAFLFGVSMAASGQFRFAAMEAVDPEHAGQAVSILLMAGLGAAFIGPEIGFLGKDLLAAEYAGSFVLLAVCYLIAIVVLCWYQPLSVKASIAALPVRPLMEIVRQPIFMASLSCAAVGFAVMSLVMTATPISMHIHHAFTVEDTKWVIQSHVIAMYLPSLFTGFLIRKWGSLALLQSGITIYFICLLVGFVEQQYIHYWSALVLLGVGWNFMFVTATSILPKSYNESEKFKVQGINDFIIFSLQATAALSAGWIIHQFGWHGLLLSCVPLLLLAATLIFYWRLSERRSLAVV